MKQLFLNNQRRIVMISSIIGLILFAMLIIHGIMNDIRISTSSSGLYSAILKKVFLIPLVIPALLGLFYYVKGSVNNTLVVSISFLVYFLTNIITYYAYFTAVDALEAGILFVIFGIPVSVAVSIILVILIFKK